MVLHDNPSIDLHIGRNTPRDIEDEQRPPQVRAQPPSCLTRLEAVPAAVAAGISGIFMETHPDPDAALSDGPNSWPMGKIKQLLTQLIELDKVVKRQTMEML